MGRDTLTPEQIEKRRAYDRAYHKKNRDKRNARGAEKRAKYKAKRVKLIELFGDKCMDCQYTFHPNVYDFHHRVPEDKEFSLEFKAFSKRWEKVMTEASKCDMLCRNCHAIRHIKMKES